MARLFCKITPGPQADEPTKLVLFCIESILNIGLLILYIYVIGHFIRKFW